MEEIEMVYVLKQKFTDFVKIGITTNFKKKARYRQLQTASPTGLEVLNEIFVENGKTAEKIIHTKFARKRLNGEWFYLAPNEIDEIVELVEPKIIETNQLPILPLLGRHEKNLEVIEESTLKKTLKKKITPITPSKFKLDFGIFN